MRTLYLFSHWQTGNTTIQLAIAALIMDTYGFDTIEKWSAENTGIPVFTDAMWDANWPFILEGHDPLGFRSMNAMTLQGYFQNSEPLILARDRIFTLFKDSRLHFPSTKSGATIKDLMEAPPAFDLCSTDVVTHVRLGDYRENNWIADPASQLAILRKIRRDEPATRIIVVCQSPVTDAERNYLRFFEEVKPIFHHRTELEDFATLRSANRILITKSTFSWVAAWLGHASQRWIPDSLPCSELYSIDATDISYVAACGYDMSRLDIPTETLPVTGEFFQAMCDFAVLDQARKTEAREWEGRLEHLGDWITLATPSAKQLLIEQPWPDAVYAAKSLFVFPDRGILDTVVARGPWPALRLLIIHNGDTEANYAVLIPFLDANPKIHVWLQNNVVSHPQIRTLPILEQNRIWRGGRLDWDPPVSISRNPRRDGDILYTSCSATHPIRKEWWEEILPLRQRLRRLDLYANRLPREEFIELLQTYTQVVCPPGNGVDTHRAWEAIENGAWAIVQNNAHTRCLLKEYPSLPLIPIESPKDLENIPRLTAPAPFHPVVLRQFWITLYSSYLYDL
jgi:hypothetical protein